MRRFYFLLSLCVLAMTASAQSESVYDGNNCCIIKSWSASGSWRNGFNKANPHKTLNIQEFYRQHHKNPNQWYTLFKWLQNTDLQTIPKGKYDISVCLGTACFVKGSSDILERAKSKLGIDEGQTTDDQMFSLETMRCVGACGLAPVFTVNDKVYGNATVKLMDEVIDELKNQG